MKVDKIKIDATIPVYQYANIQPGIEISEVEDTKTAIDYGMSFMKELFSKYSEKGSIKESEESTRVVITKNSFNEGVPVLFEPVSHTYKHGNKDLVSSTQYISKFYKKFDEENISKASAKAWGVEQEKLRLLWKKNGELTSDFGTSVHNALELYENFKQIGEDIQKKKAMPENYALPKHPILRSIVLGFVEINKTIGRVVPEALITDIEKGFCGHADRVLITDEENKICRIQDYKINIGSEEVKRDMKPLEPFNELPANKITKYQLQMSFYANMLENSGWTVEGLDVFVFEDEWKHFELSVLKVI
jgi:hypothetical protein